MIFDITKKMPDIDGFIFCKKIMLPYTTDRRSYLTHLLIENKICYSTDGTRIHSFEPTYEFKNGLYLITICRSNLVQIIKTDLGTNKFPDCKSLLDEKDYVTIAEMISIEHGFPSAIYKINNAGICIDPLRVKDLKDDFDIMVHKDEPEDKPVLFVNGKKKAAIMPMRMN